MRNTHPSHHHKTHPTHPPTLPPPYNRGHGVILCVGVGVGRVRVSTPNMLHAIKLMEVAKKNGSASPKLDKVVTMLKTHLSILTNHNETQKLRHSGVSNREANCSHPPLLCVFRDIFGL